MRCQPPAALRGFETRLLRPTAQQQAVIDHEQGRAVVVAVAGAGKTTTIARRIGRLVHQVEVPPGRILATTFNRYARGQIREKLDHLAVPAGVAVRTLHALAQQILKLEADPWPLAADGEMRRLFYDMQSAIRQGRLDLPLDLSSHEQRQIADLNEESFLNYLGYLKGDLRFSAWQFEQLPTYLQAAATLEVWPESQRWLNVCVDAFEQCRQEARLRSFDDLLVDACRLLCADMGIRERVRSRFDFLIVDEYQDINRAQNLIISVLDEAQQNLMVVGDDDQTIYEWRGARPQLILDKLRDRQWVQYTLDRNFRSRAPQLLLANALIRHNCLRSPKQLQGTKAWQYHCEWRSFPSGSAQAAAIAEQILEYRDRGKPLSDLVILIRTYAQTPLIEQQLMAAQLPYVIPGSQPFYLRREVKLLLAYLEFAAAERNRVQNGLTPANRDRYDQLFRETSSRPSRYLKRPELLSMLQEALDNPHLPLATIVSQRCRDRLGRNRSLQRWLDYLGWVLVAQPSSAAAAIAKLEQLLDLRRWIIDSDISPESGAQKALILDALQAFAGDRDLQSWLQEMATLQEQVPLSDEGSGVNLLTVFKAKGLEWDTVFIPDLDAGIYPFGASRESESGAGRNSFDPLAEVVLDRSLQEEERRILYVALTRSINNLHLSSATNQRSPFLKEAQISKIQTRLPRLRALATGQLQQLNDRQRHQLIHIDLAFCAQQRLHEVLVTSLRQLPPQAIAQHCYTVQQWIQDAIESDRPPLKSDLVQQFWAEIMAELMLQKS